MASRVEGERAVTGLPTEQALVRAIVRSTHDAIYSKDDRALVTSWNRGAERLYGYSAQDAIGRHISFLIPEERQGEEQEILERALAGEEIDVYETQRRCADGTRVDVSLTVSPVTDPERGIIGASVIARDITLQRRAAKAQHFLAAASAALDASLHPGETLRTIVRTAVPELAELCIIDLIRDDGSIGGAVAAATDMALARELETLRSRSPLRPEGRHPVAQVLRARRSVVLRDLTTPDVIRDVAQSDEHRDFMVRAGYNSAAVVPMFARGRLLGAISLLHVRNDQRYEADDLALLEDLASRAAMAYDNARLYAERARVARTLQQSLLPAVLPRIPGYSVAAAYQPAGEGNEVGGDFYDVFDDGSDWTLIVGDVCGKGAEAAAVTALIRHSVRALSLIESDPVALLRRVNESLLRSEMTGRFATAALARLTGGTRQARLRIAVAGHPPPMVVSTDGTVRPVDARGDLLGIHPEATFGEQEVHLGRGDTLVLYTDGLLEAGAPHSVMSPDQAESLLAACAGLPPLEVVRFIERRTLGLSGGRPRDDLAVLALTVGA